MYSSLKAADIHYTLLSDSNLEAAKAFHIAYRLDEATLEMQKKYGVDLEKTSGTSLHQRYKGGRVYYITTAISSTTMTRNTGFPYVPRPIDAIPD